MSEVMLCPACGAQLSGEGAPGAYTVCLGCDVTLKIPELMSGHAEQTAIWFEQIAPKDVPIKMMVGLDTMRQQIKRARNGKS